jgi:hypothetical protein
LLAGLVIARTLQRPVAGNIPSGLPRDVAAKLWIVHAVDIDQVPLNQAIDQLSKTYGLPIVLPAQSLRSMSSDADRPISLNLPAANFFQVLGAIEEDYGIFATWDGEHVVLGAEGPIGAAMVARYYDLQPILQGRGASDDDVYDKDDIQYFGQRIPGDLDGWVVGGWSYGRSSDLNRGIYLSRNGSTLTVWTNILRHELIAARLNETAQGRR